MLLGNYAKNVYFVTSARGLRRSSLTRGQYFGKYRAAMLGYPIRLNLLINLISSYSSLLSTI